jgi:cysteine desulfurase
MLPCFGEHFGNPSSGHVCERLARHAVENARNQVASLIGAEPEEIVLTSGGTEANNLAILGAAGRVQLQLIPRVPDALAHRRRA